MKNKKLLLGLLAITLAFGMMVTGCNNGGGGSSTPKKDPEVAKKLRITGITGITTPRVDVFLLDPSDNEADLVAGGSSTRSGTVTIDLKKLNKETKDGKITYDFTSENWTGKGTYHILLIETDGSGYVFVETTAHYVMNINFQDQTTTVSYADFREQVWNPSINFSFSVK